MSGYGNRTTPSQGVAQPIHAKALALKDPDGRHFVLVTTDLIGFSHDVAEGIAARVAREYHISRERLLLSSSHTHTGPAIAGNLPLMQPPTPELQASTQRYTRYLQDQVVAVVGQALDGLAPAKLSYHVGKAGFAQNRRFRSPDGTFKIADNPGGLVDHDVPVLRVDGADGKLRAVLLSYAAHNTTLGGKDMAIHGDYAGEMQAYWEKAHPGATALFMLGCAGDANPRRRGSIEAAKENGRELADAVDAAITKRGLAIQGPLHATFERFPIRLEPVPDRAEWERRAREAEGLDKQIAEYFLGVLDSKGAIAETYEYPLQVLKLGDKLELIALGGEVTVGYALQLKQKLGPATTWVVAYSNDVMSYIPTVQILGEGGYEPERSQMYYGMPGKWDPSIEKTILDRALAAAER
ncbi:MAG: neutral/alkaline non-lysosomal ceramidase N-terminal domain-containing protein [Bryobacterales bacterium]